MARISAAYGRLKVADLQLAYVQAKSHFPELRIPSKLQLLWAMWISLLAPSKVYTRADLHWFWHAAKQNWAERRWFRIPLHRVALNLFRDASFRYSSSTSLEPASSATGSPTGSKGTRPPATATGKEKGNRI